MCGRFCCALDPDSIRHKLYEDHISNDKHIKWIDQTEYHSSYNIAPTKNIVVLHTEMGNKEQVLHSMQWGYIPSWSRNVSMNKPINARVETLSDKCMFDSSKNTKRCVIIAEGFYEWKKLSNNKKQPYFIKRKDGQLMVFAGLYDANSFIGKDLHTCTIITTHSSSFFEPIHNRMPVILENKDIAKWIDKNISWSQSVIDLLKPFEGELLCYQVSDKVGPVKNDSPDLIVPVDTKKSSISYYFLKEEEKKPSEKFEKFALEQEFKNATESSLLSAKSSSSSSSQESKTGSNNDSQDIKNRRLSVESSAAIQNKRKGPTNSPKDANKNNNSMKITNFFGKK